MVIEKLAWINLRDQTILTARSRNKDIYYLPGGKREPGEADHEALIREIREELSVDLLPETLQPLGQFEAPADGRPEGTRVRMICYTGDYRGQLASSSEIDEIAWLRYEDRHRVSEAARRVFEFLHGRQLLGQQTRLS